MQTIIISLILGLIYFNTPVQQKTIMNINGLLFQAANNMNFMFQFAALGVSFMLYFGNLCFVLLVVLFRVPNLSPWTSQWILPSGHLLFGKECGGGKK